MAKFLWTDEREAALARMWTVEGKSGSVIADALGGGLTRSAVMGKINRLALVGKKARGTPRPKADGGDAYV